MRYVCLLRGINVGGKNSVSMAELRAALGAAGFTDVATHGNSGNVRFSSPETSRTKLIGQIETLLAQQWPYALKVTVLSQQQLAAILQDAPKSWGVDPAWKHNLLVLRPPATPQDVLDAIAPRAEVEMVTAGDGVVYWSADLKQWGRTALSSFASQPIYQEITVRVASTSRKLLALLEK